MLGRPFWELGMAVDSHYRQLAYAIEDELVRLMSAGTLSMLANSMGIEYLIPELYAESLSTANTQ